MQDKQSPLLTGNYSLPTRAYYHPTFILYLLAFWVFEGGVCFVCFVLEACPELLCHAASRTAYLPICPHTAFTFCLMWPWQVGYMVRILASPIAKSLAHLSS